MSQGGTSAQGPDRECMGTERWGSRVPPLSLPKHGLYGSLGRGAQKAKLGLWVTQQSLR